MNNLRKSVYILIFVFAISPLFSENKSVYMDFRNQKISDIIYSLADVCEKSVLIDETVSGNTTFHFEDKTFEDAIKRFSDYCHLYVTKQDDVYRISKVEIKEKSKGRYSINTENVDVVPFLNMLSRETATTIMYDSLPNVTITIREQDSTIEDVLNLCVVKLPGFILERIAGGYYLAKSSSNNQRRNIDSFTLSVVEDKFNLAIQKADFSNVIETLFKKANKEYSMLAHVNYQFEGLNYVDKNFDELLKLVLLQVNCDYSIQNDIYHIFEVQRKDILKSYKETRIINLVNLTTEKLSSLMPPELNSSSFIRFDKSTNTVILSGSSVEINPIEQFIYKVDTAVEGSVYKRFELSNITVREALQIIPPFLLRNDVYEIPGYKGFVTLVTEEDETRINEFLSNVDIGNINREIKLKYIRCEDLLKSLPPSVDKENIRESSNPNLLFFRGSEAAYQSFLNELEKIDIPRQQIRYELLVIQKQKTNGTNYGTNFSAGSSSKSGGYSWNGTLSNIFNINFDIISQFGVQFAGSLNAEISEGKSHVLADTTLNGISGETINFSNTNTYRYRDIIVDKNGEIYTSTTREIASGLVININGWVSGNDMVTVKVDAQVSKQGVAESTVSDTTNPPSTSEKKVSTNVRTKSGEPVVIGGLIQNENDSSEKGVPFISKIPFFGHLFKKATQNSADTEFIIYLVPFVEKSEMEFLTEESNLERLKLKYESK